jgi:hypothetical protein
MDLLAVARRKYGKTLVTYIIDLGRTNPATRR